MRLWGLVREVWDMRDARSVEIPAWAAILRSKGLRIISGGYEQLISVLIEQEGQKRD